MPLKPVLCIKVNFGEATAKTNITLALSLTHLQMGINVVSSSQVAPG